MKTPLRRKILLSSSSLLIVLIVAMLVYVGYRAGVFVDGRIQSELLQGRESIKGAEAERLRNLKLTANLVASTPTFFALLRTRDNATIRDGLLSNFQPRMSTDLLIAVDPSGVVLARTDTADPLPVPPDLEGGILKTESGVYHVAKMPADSTGILLGYIIAGALIDDTFARTLAETSKSDVVIVEDMVLGSSLSRASLEWQTRADWGRFIARDTDPRPVVLKGDKYLAVSTLLGPEGGPRPLVVIMQSHDRLMQPYLGIQFGLLILGIMAAIAGIAISAVLARNITAPVAKLLEATRQVAAGNFDYRLDISATDEIGELAHSFNVMNQGLRERADMQKFVSQSTVDMIQSASSRKVSAGEKVVLTILFSDMRGFTAMTENRTPEETVKLLNSCLSLQAQRVKKYHGDIDKFVGDCVVALFQGDDMALNAIRCAVETHRALQESNAPLRIGIGIVTGEVILGSIGSEDRLDYTVIGSNVNLCSRLCDQAGPGETLIAESTYRLVEGLVAAEKIAPLQVKGFKDAIPAYKMRS